MASNDTNGVLRQDGGAEPFDLDRGRAEELDVRVRARRNVAVDDQVRDRGRQPAQRRALACELRGEAKAYGLGDDFRAHPSSSDSPYVSMTARSSSPS